MSQTFCQRQNLGSRTRHVGDLVGDLIGDPEVLVRSGPVRSGPVRSARVALVEFGLKMTVNERGVVCRAITQGAL